MTYLTRWATVGTVVTILLNGCASTPPTPVPTPLPSDTPAAGTGTNSSTDAGSATSGSASSDNTTGGATTPPSNPMPSTNTTTTSEDEANYHTVAAKETLYSIAKKYKRTAAEIKAWNHLTSNKLSVGQRLRIAAPAGDTTTSPPPSTSCHKVVRGDTLYNIAKHYGHKVAEVAQWNKISKPYNLKVGQLLRVSADSSCQ